MRDDERFYTRHRQLVTELANRIVNDRKFMRESIGPGGVKLKRQEVLDRYMEIRDDPAGHTAAIQREQAKWGMAPNEIPLSYLRSIVRYERELQRKEGDNAGTLA